MSKRFTETNKWEDKWFRSLRPLEKLLFNYLCDKCNLAGFIEFDVELIAFHTGMTNDEILGAKQGLNRGLLGAENWVWICNFLRHQKNLPLNPDNNAHKNIIQCINEQCGRFELNVIVEKLGADKGLFSPIGKGKGKVVVKEGGVGETNNFDLFWNLYPLKKSKGDAEKAWKTINPNKEVVASILTAIPKLKETEQWKKENGKYIPYPATWLRAKGWHDEIATTKPTGINVQEFSN